MAAQLTFKPETHEYRLDGQVVPSVTQVVHRVFPGWQADEMYLARGTALHEACQALDEDFLDWSTVPSAIAGKVRAWQAFTQDCGMIAIDIERPLASQRYRFAGTLDRTFSYPGVGLVVCDLKSTIESRVRVQLGGYSLLLTESGQKPDRGVAVELRQDGTYRTLWLDRAALKICEQTFLGALTVFNFMETHR